MMGISPSEASELSWGDYQALLWNFHYRRSGDAVEEVEAPDMDAVLLQFAKIERRGLARSAH